MVTIFSPSFVKRTLLATLFFTSIQYTSNAQLHPESLQQLKVRSYQMCENLGKGQGLGAVESFFGSFGQKIAKGSHPSVSQGLKGIHISLGSLKEFQSQSKVEDKYLPSLLLLYFDKYLHQIEAFIAKHSYVDKHDKLRLSSFKKMFHTKKALFGKTFHRSLGKRAVYLMHFLRALKRQVDYSTDDRPLLAFGRTDKISFLNELFIICETFQELRIYVQQTKPMSMNMSIWNAGSSPKRIALTYLIFFEWHILTHICTKLDELLESIDQTTTLAIATRSDYKDEKHAESEATAAAVSPRLSLLGRSPSPDATYGARLLAASLIPTPLPNFISRTPSPEPESQPQPTAAPVNRPPTPFELPLVGRKPALRINVHSPSPASSEPSTPIVTTQVSLSASAPVVLATSPQPSPPLDPAVPVDGAETSDGEFSDEINVPAGNAGADFLFIDRNLPDPNADDPEWGVTDINLTAKRIDVRGEELFVSKAVADAEEASAMKAAGNDFEQVTADSDEEKSTEAKPVQVTQNPDDDDWVVT